MSHVDLSVQQDADYPFAVYQPIVQRTDVTHLRSGLCSFLSLGLSLCIAGISMALCFDSGPLPLLHSLLNLCPLNLLHQQATVTHLHWTRKASLCFPQLDDSPLQGMLQNQQAMIAIDCNMH